jgi:DsbC/DsbD-like thiol-disulfide interchange protein
MLALDLLMPALAFAEESNLQRSPRATVSLVSEHAAVSPGQKVRIGLRQRLAPHWHTYWKNPGDAGSPPNIEFNLPAGASVGAIAWPGPDRFLTGPVASYGDENEIVFPMTLTGARDRRQSGRTDGQPQCTAERGTARSARRDWQGLRCAHHAAHVAQATTRPYGCAVKYKS